jgi:hypothetical protein
VPFLAIIYAQLLVTLNTERLLIVAAPVVIVAALIAVEVRLRGVGERRRQRSAIAAGALVAARR